MRSLSALLALGLLATACSVPLDDVELAIESAALDRGLPAIGPIPESTHWHAAYVVRVCDDVLDPFLSDADPLGIHSHADGIMHVHPFFEESGYENATIGHFADAMGFSIRAGELILPSGEAWRDGDECNGVPGRVFVDKWSDPDPSGEVIRHFEDLENLRYEADGELYQIAFAPWDTPPVVPPTSSRLDEYSNLAAPAEPWIPQLATAEQRSFWLVESVDVEPCEGDAVIERATYGPIRCFTPRSDKLSATDAVVSARAVTFNRQAAVEVTMTDDLHDLVDFGFADGREVIAIAVEVDGAVITAPLLERPPVSDRLVLAGGFSPASARSLANALNGS